MTKHILMLVGGMGLAGSSVVVAKILTSQAPVFFTTFWSLAVALFCMVPMMRGRWAELRSLSLHHYLNLFLQGLCGIVLFRLFIFYGLRSTGAVEAGIITGTTPAVLALLSWIVLGEKPGKRGLWGVVLAAAGCILLNSGITGGSASKLLGPVLVAAAVISEAFFTIFRKKIATEVSATTNTTVLLACSLLLVAVPAMIEMKEMRATDNFPGPGTILAILYYGMFATVLAYLLWTSAVGKVSGAVAGSATAVMPATAVLLGALLLGEQLVWNHLLGCSLIIAGIFVTSCRWPKNAICPGRFPLSNSAQLFEKFKPSWLRKTPGIDG